MQPSQGLHNQVVKIVVPYCILMLRASLGKVGHTVGRAGTYAAKVSLQELHKIAVRERTVVKTPSWLVIMLS
jgi:hypothetical protein